MIEPPSSGTIELEAKKLKRDLEGWREVILPVYSILTWTRPSDPGILIGASSFVFLIFWYLDPTLLSTIALIGLFTAILDLVVPNIIAQFVQPNCWTANKERQLEKISRSLAVTKLSANRNMYLFLNLRSERPTVFYAVVITTLFLLSWIGNVVNNLLLTYLTVSVALLIPGILHSGFVTPYLEPIGKVLCPLFSPCSSAKKEK